MSIWPALIYIGITILSLGINLAKHGEEGKSKTNFYTTFLGTILVYTLLWWGGFFNALFHRS